MEFDPRERQGYIGGSDVSCILGVNPYRTKYGLYEEKTTDDPQAIPENEPMYWGKALEAPVIERWIRERQTGDEALVNAEVKQAPPEDRKRLRASLMGKIQHPLKRLEVVNITHPTKPYIKGHPDAVFRPPLSGQTNKRYVIEAKTASHWMADKWKDGPPSHYYWQLVYYAMLLDRHNKDKTLDMEYWMVVLIGGNDYREYKIDITRTDMRYVENETTRFWKCHVLPKVYPSYTTPTEEINRHKFPVQDGSTLMVDQFMAETVKKYHALKESSEKSSAEASRLKELIKHKLGLSSNMVYKGESIAKQASYTKATTKWKQVVEHLMQDGAITKEQYTECVNSFTETITIKQLR